MAILKTIFDVLADKASALRGKEPSADHRIFKALETANDGPGADGWLLNELLQRKWPLVHNILDRPPTDEEKQSLRNNYALFSSLAKARLGKTAELDVRDNLNELAKDKRYAGMVSYMRAHPGELEDAARQTALRPRAATLTLKYLLLSKSRL